MGLLDVNAAQSNSAAENPLQAAPSTLGERVAATTAETFAPDRYFMLEGARRDLWQRSVDELHSTTGQAFANPYGAVTPEEMMRLGNQPAVTAERSQKIIEASRSARAAGNDNLFDPENIDRYIGEEATRRRDTAGQLVGTGNGVGNFLAGAAISSIEPVNAIGLVLPVGRLGTATASSVGRTFLGSVAREAGVQAGFNVALQGLTEGLDYTSRSETGTPQTAGEIAGNVAGAAVFGALFGGSVKALHLMWTGLPESIRENAPTQVKDAFRTIEADALYSGQNRLGVDPTLHERYQGNALDAVMRGKPVDFAELNRTADNPMTALGTILQQAPDRIRAEGVDLGPLIDRVRALPDSEIEAFARESKPNSFARLDKVEGQLADLRSQREEISQRAPTLADMVDPDTAMRLQDIEADLAKPGLRRQAREALEQERDMISQTVDPKDRLPKEAEKKQRAQLADLDKQIARLEPQHQEARATAEAATADLRRKLDRHADLATPAPEVAQDLGYQAPADLGAAIVRADALRQSRMMREILPDGPKPGGDPVVRPVAPEKAAAEPTPEELKTLDTQAAAVLEQPGRGDLRRAAQRDLDAADVQMKDAQAALGCVMGGGGIP